MIAAKNGWRLAKTEARAGPTRSMAVNQSRFVSTSGPSTANAKPIQASAPMSKLWSPSCGRGEQQERDRDDAEEDRAQPERRVAAHERGDGNGVAAPRRGAEHREQVPAEVRGDALPGPHRDERDARKGERRRDPESPPEPFDPDEARDERREDRQRPEEERRGGGGRQVEREDEAELVDQQEHDGERDERQVPAADPERALARERERDEHERGRRVAERRVRKRAQPGVEDVLRDREVERPDGDGQQQHQVGC